MATIVEDYTDEFIFLDGNIERKAYLIHEDDKMRRFRIADGQEIEINVPYAKDIRELENDSMANYWESRGCIYKLASSSDIISTRQKCYQIFSMIVKEYNNNSKCRRSDIVIQ